VTSLNYLWSPSTGRHFVGQVAFGLWSKIYVPSTVMNRRSNGLALLDPEHKNLATNTSTTMNYANVAYDSLTYNMASTSITIESNTK